jgi:hypothetical protein
MIGQGVVNFGGFFGVLAAALLMAYWVVILARQDLRGENGPYAFVFHWMCFDFQPGKGYHAHYFISIFVWVFHACILG